MINNITSCIVEANAENKIPFDCFATSADDLVTTLYAVTENDVQDLQNAIDGLTTLIDAMSNNNDIKVIFQKNKFFQEADFVAKRVNRSGTLTLSVGDITTSITQLKILNTPHLVDEFARIIADLILLQNKYGATPTPL